MAPLRSLILLLSISLSPLIGLSQICESGLGYCDSESVLSSKILITGGTVVNADHQEVADVYIEDGVIVDVRPNIKIADGIRVVDATGKFVMPGGIDPHTHLAMEFMGTETIDNFFSGQAAALAGGTTMHIDFVIPVNGSLTKGYEAYVEKAKLSCMDYGFHMAITKWDDIVSKEMEIMVKEKGINSFKFFMAYKGSLMISDELLLEGLKKCKSLGALAMVHAENGDAVFEGQKRMIELGITGPEGHVLSRPPVLEGEATARAIRLASFVNTPLYIVHVMSIDAMEEIARARKSGQKVIGEPVVSGLVLDDSVLWDPDFITAAKFVMSPPIRASGHGKALQAALSTGILKLVGTDHCTFNSTQKSFGVEDFRKIPNGVNGLEERMHLVWDTMVESGQLSVTDFVHVTSTECAKLFNIYPRKGINSFKFFMAYKGSLMISDELLLEGLKKCKSLGALAMVHAENGDAVFEGQKRMIELGITGPEGHVLSRPPVLEGEATARAIRLASFVNTPLYIVHVMSIDAMEEIARARKSGQKVIGEPVVSGLVLDDSVLWDPDFITAAKFVMSPPIRASGHGKALQAALSTGILKLVGTDHCTFNSTQKSFGVEDFRKIPNGVNGLEERMHLVWDTMVESGQLSVTDFVHVTSTECAKLFNIYPRKGAIRAGSDADIIIFNPNSTFHISASSHHSKSDTNVYEGRSGKGKVEVTIAGGKIVWENEELMVVPGSGKYISMPPFNYLYHGIDKADEKYLTSLKAPVDRVKPSL